jgi:hypothetical protein
MTYYNVKDQDFFNLAKDQNIQMKKCNDVLCDSYELTTLTFYFILVIDLSHWFIKKIKSLLLTHS